MFYSFTKAVVLALFKVVGHLKVIGSERVPRTGGAILAANHTSYADPPVMGVSTPRAIRFMAKSELFKNSVFAAVIRALGAFPVKRGTADRQALRTAHDILTSGQLLVIFFEGGRSPDGKLQSPELGTAMIALRANVPIVPVALINADHLLPRHAKALHWSHVTAVFGEPLTFPHLAGKAGDRAALQEVSTAIARSVADLMRTHGAAERVPDGYLVEGATDEH